ncbi:MAG TPA: DoxX family protein [Woeseiaceae bacterium]|nr:DoxX family protein [Woeseiaceae bacterium]
MNSILWILQGLLAVHTVIGAVWKFSNSAGETMPSLGAIPNAAWLGLAVIELLCAAALVIPMFKASLSRLAPIAALVIGAEMLLFCVLHLASGATDVGPIAYWLVVAAVCAFIAYGRFNRSGRTATTSA